MKTNSPKYDEHLKNVMHEDRLSRNISRPGIIQAYDPKSHTATVLMSAPDSDARGNILTNVLCPVFPGIQNVAPDLGRPCFVVFRNGQNDKKAMISHYFNHNYNKYEYTKHNFARSAIPTYMTGL